MTPGTLLKLQAVMHGPPEHDHPKPDRLIAGNPRRDTWSVVDTALPPGRLYCGVWHCEPGHWRIEMAPGEHELFTVLSGRCRVHAQGAGFEEAGPGEAIYIPAGFVGSFEVIEPLSKTYTIVTADG
jgi:uncharacterized cupin superfamily protein